MRTPQIIGLAVLVLSICGCGYRAPLYKTVVTEDPARFENIREDFRPLAALMTSDTGLSPTDSNTVVIFPDGKGKFAALRQDLESAEESIYIDHFRFSQDSSGTIVHSILKDRREGGADVRVIVDRFAHTRKDIKKLALYASDSIDVRFFHRPSWILDYVCPPGGVHRDHRKILLIDGKTAYMGSRNIQDRYFNNWKDLDIRINGPAVYDLGVVYMQNQQFVAPELPPVKVTEESVRKAVADTLPAHDALQGVTIQIVPDNPWDKRLPIRNSFEWSVNHAQDYFYYYSPYSPPPKSSLRALKEAAKRGVDVRWIVPAHNDIPSAKWIGEAVYLELLNAGVRIFEWQGPMMHAKEFITDDYLVSIGSANIDNLSFFLNMEVSALLYDKRFSVVSRDSYLKEIRENCLEITLDDARNWNMLRKFRNWIFRLFAGSMS